MGSRAAIPEQGQTRAWSYRRVRQGGFSDQVLVGIRVVAFGLNAILYTLNVGMSAPRIWGVSVAP